MPFSGTPVQFSRFIGYMDQDTSDNLPIGLAALARNCYFEFSSVRTRDGLGLAMQGINPSPITGILGLLYTPETETEQFIQLPTIFDLAGALQYESPVGSGHMHEYDYDLFVPPDNAHMIGVQAYNKGWATFTDLKTPLSRMCSIDPKTKIVDPYGMKPYGWTWTASQPVMVGEMATPTTPGGNGHTYRCIQAGTTGAVEPVWPTGDGVEVADGTARWQEWTAVMANRLPNPDAPVGIVVAGGSIPNGTDVWMVWTYSNPIGESLGSTPVKVTVPGSTGNTVRVVAPTKADLPSWIQELSSRYFVQSMNLYVAFVATGAQRPPTGDYQRYANVALGGTVNVTAAPTSRILIPGKNTARVTPGQLPAPDTQPVIQRVSNIGAFPAGRDVYVLNTFVNGNGETTVGPVNVLINTQNDDAVQVTVQQPLDDNNNPLYEMTAIGVYEADVPTGTGQPDPSLFCLFGYFNPGETVDISQSASGPPPPTTNTTGPGGNIVSDSPTGGLNGGQGYRYSGILYMNRAFSVSGFTAASVIQCDVDEDGWEIGFFHLPIGPDNIVARIAAPTVADGSNAGPFYWIGNYNPQIPSANYIYPQTKLSDQIPMTATILADNKSNQMTVNFTDEFLEASNDVTDRLRVIWPNPCTHIYFSETQNIMIQCGSPGFYSTALISVPGDIESYYGDTMEVSVGADDGQRAWGVCEYRDTLYLMRERSGFTIQASTSTPNTWIARRKWKDVGPCGPRAFDSCDKFIIFVHRSGIYKYGDEQTTPDLMTKEIPRFWEAINWDAAETICCKINYEMHTVHFLFPINGSSVPNIEVTLNYLEGWQNPVHFSTYSAREIAMDACRKYSINDIEAFVCDRIERQCPLPPDAPQWNPDLVQTPTSFYTNQWVYGSSGPDGGVNALTPGRTDDNGVGIDWQYETVSTAEMMALCKLEGFNLNANGNGQIGAYFISGKELITDVIDGQTVKGRILKVKRPIDLVYNQSVGISRGLPGRTSERWRMGFTNNKQPGIWASLKFLTIFVIPIFSGREESERGS